MFFFAAQQITIIYFAPTNDKIDTGSASGTCTSSVASGAAVEQVLHLPHRHAPQALAEDVDDFVVRLDGALAEIKRRNFRIFLEEL